MAGMPNASLMLNLFKKYPSLWVTAIVSLLAHGVIMAWVSDWYESPMTRLQSSAAPSIEIKLMPRVLPLPEKIVALHQPEPEPEILKAPVETPPPPPPKKISTKSKYISRERIVCQQVSNIHLEKRLKFAKIPGNIVLGNSCNFLIFNESYYLINHFFEFLE